MTDWLHDLYIPQSYETYELINVVVLVILIVTTITHSAKRNNVCLTGCEKNMCVIFSLILPFGVERLPKT